jgi:hypothetical protein
MSRPPVNLQTTPHIVPLSISEQNILKGGMAATEEEKRKKVKKFK